MNLIIEAPPSLIIDAARKAHAHYWRAERATEQTPFATYDPHIPDVTFHIWVKENVFHIRAVPHNDSKR